MKKLFIFIVLLFFGTCITNADVTKIDFKWTKMVKFDMVSLSEKDFNDGHILCNEDGSPMSILIKYDDFGSAGSLCEVYLDLGGTRGFDGSTGIILQDVNIGYNTDNGSFILSNKLGENILLCIPDTKISGHVGFLLIYDIYSLL